MAFSDKSNEEPGERTLGKAGTSDSPQFLQHVPNQNQRSNESSKEISTEPNPGNRYCSQCGASQGDLQNLVSEEVATQLGEELGVVHNRGEYIQTIAKSAPYDTIIGNICQGGVAGMILNQVGAPEIISLIGAGAYALGGILRDHSTKSEIYQSQAMLHDLSERLKINEHRGDE